MSKAIQFATPIGHLEIVEFEDNIINISFLSQPTSHAINESSILLNAKTQLLEYFAGTRQLFDIPIYLQGTDFQINVWKYISNVKYGTTATYSDLATSMGMANKVRAVANANAQNVLAIVVPCHRIVGSSGSLTGYAWELWRKRWLLNHERKYSGTGYQTNIFGDDEQGHFF
ncbi:MAG: methylated-DNA--[protein]-cysteine S-methyltransferase [Cytophagales bacterium]|nr:methylated-DNA--[protein]-cysteine S-methyltransferase [Cytophagales bacterium]